MLLFFLGGELGEQPRDFLWGYIAQEFQGLTGNAQPFWAFIFLSHGLVKMVLLLGLFKNRLWAYPASAAVFGLFAIYQTYSYIYFPSLFLALLTVFDIVLIGLILHEYKHKRKLRNA